MFKKLTTLTTFGILSANGDRWFASANRVKIRRGRLIFLVGLWRIVAVANEGTWINTAEGIESEGIGDNK